MGAGTQYTVNNQMVNATLMNIADNPTNVQLPGVYKNEDIPRVPVVCTGQPSCHALPCRCRCLCWLCVCLPLQMHVLPAIAAAAAALSTSSCMLALLC